MPLDAASAEIEPDHQMVWCTCGEIVLASLGDGFVITIDRERRWMRRRSDFIECRNCRRRYVFSDLQELVASAGP